MKNNISRQKTEKIIVVICWLLMPIYLYFVIKLTLRGRGFKHRRINLWPFWEVRKLLETGAYSYWIKQIFNNIIMLLPWGLMLSFMSEKLRCFKRIIMVGFGFSLCIETTQFFTRRGLFELDDLFHNTLGALIGYGIYLLADRLLLSRLSDEKNE